MRNSPTHNQELTKLSASTLLPLAPTGAFGAASTLGAFVLIALAMGVLNLSVGAPSVLISALIYACLALAFLIAMHRTYPHDSLGLCNLVTLSRLVIIGVLIAAILQPVPATFELLALAVFCLCLDGADGWLARRQNLASDFGARFDVEVDAVFALVLALYAARTGAAGWYVIALGLPHYLFWVARSLLPWLNAPLPERFSRKAICVLQIGTLIALLVPQIGGQFLDALVVVAASSLIWSFGRDILWLYRSRS